MYVLLRLIPSRACPSPLKSFSNTWQHPRLSPLIQFARWRVSLNKQSEPRGSFDVRLSNQPLCQRASPLAKRQIFACHDGAFTQYELLRRGFMGNLWGEITQKCIHSLSFSSDLEAANKDKTSDESPAGKAEPLMAKSTLPYTQEITFDRTNGRWGDYFSTKMCLSTWLWVALFSSNTYCT